MEPLSPFDDPNVSDEVKEALGLVYEGLDDSNLAPLNAYLRAGYPLFPDVTENICLAIDDGRITITPLKVSGPSEATKAAAQDLRMQVGAFVYVRLRAAKRGELPRILKRATDRFAVSEGRARASLQEFRKGWSSQGDGSLILAARHWFRASRELCEETGVNYDDMITAMFLSQET